VSIAYLSAFRHPGCFLAPENLPQAIESHSRC
jgi:hypothetical protein